MPMTPKAKSALSSTIRSLRTRLLDDLHAATEGAYRLSLKPDDARLGEAARIRRERLESWIFEQVRSLPKKAQAGASERFRLEVEKDAASTLLNRIVYLRLLEANGLREERVATGGWDSPGYKQFREFAAELVRGDESEGYAQLLQLIFDDLAIDLPGLYGNVRLTALIPVPAATLRAVVEALDTPELESCWTDDMTLGWIYQYWNDPEREALDAKLNDGGKVEPHEIASKTQMFTERYMVDWLLQNSLGPMWLAMCRKHGWKPEVEADGTLARLEERRVEWRAKRDAGEVSLTELMPLESDAEHRWAYYVPQPIPDDAVKYANESVRDLKILDPAVGSGHFLVVAFDLLAALYREEARHRREEGRPQWSDQAIVERILEHNLHGIDLDPRAVQIAAAALWLKAQQTCAAAHPRQLNLVASSLHLSNLPEDDPARSELREEVERETGIPGQLTQRLLDALAGADHLGSLLKIDDALDRAIQEMARPFGAAAPLQGDLMEGFPAEQQRLTMSADSAKAVLLARLERFLHAHNHGDDLGLRLRGEQLAVGVRFLRLVQEGAYDLVVANPPYQGTSKISGSTYIETHYPLGKSDLYAAFLLRGLQLARAGGVSAMLTMRNWMFIKQYSDLRKQLLRQFALRAVGDFDRGAFEDVPDEVVSVAVSAFGKFPSQVDGVALMPTPRKDRSRDGERTQRKRAATLGHVGRHEFHLSAMKDIEGTPLVYWWSQETIRNYVEAPKVADYGGCREGLGTRDDTRFLRRPWETSCTDLTAIPYPDEFSAINSPWVPFVKGAAGKVWFEPLDFAVRWWLLGGEIAHFERSRYGRGAPLYFTQGIAVATMGHDFSGRLHRFRSVFGDAGVSVFVDDLEQALCAMNSRRGREALESLNPSTSFKVNDIDRLPLYQITGAREICERLRAAFSTHELHREASVEFRSPGPCNWSHIQEWAQAAVDRPEGEPLPPYVAVLDPEPPTDHLSFAFGVAVGRFGANGEGTLGPTGTNHSAALPAGICFLDGSLEKGALGDSLGHNAVELLHRKWSERGPAVDLGTDLRTWLRLKFFGDVHRGMYENRPIYFPLSSERKTFVAYVSIHRWTENTLRALLAEHLHPAHTRLEGEIADLRESRQIADKRLARDAERRYDQVVKWRQELDDFIARVEQCAEKGPPSPDARTPEREVDARYVPDLDDGVMINSAALWPLLEPQWKDPKRWWKELAAADGKKDFDWAHLAACYFPSRVDRKCQEDPSLGVAHGRFWKYHPLNAYRWELRLQDEIGPHFTIDEEGSDAFRAAFERDHPDRVAQLVAAEKKRRERKEKQQVKETAGPLSDPSQDDLAAACEA